MSTEVGLVHFERVQVEPPLTCLVLDQANSEGVVATIIVLSLPIKEQMQNWIKMAYQIFAPLR
ncbi:hypothetical protein EDC30_112113 [Paucimonas lemoignei]|uniref:Uncharacterized protein n=1 Tax=Paucimonas lemoignei TaxID=29443 RepID=A0A4R3HVM0_PAULE|nr:hypothetical protein EDC30_112113 [Paucimonas lemoignei]